MIEPINEIHIYDNAKLAWQELTERFLETDAILVVASQIAKERFLRAQGMLQGYEVLTVQEFWHKLHQTIWPRGPRELSALEFTQWIHNQDIPEWNHLLPDSVQYVADQVDNYFQYETDVDEGLSRTTRLLAAEHVTTRHGLWQYLSHQKITLDKPVIFAPLGHIYPALARAIKNLDNSCVYTLSSFTLENFTTFEHLVADPKKMVYYETEHELELAVTCAKELIESQVVPSQIAICTQDASQIEAVAQALGVPIMLRQRVRVFDTPLTSEMYEKATGMTGLVALKELYTQAVDQVNQAHQGWLRQATIAYLQSLKLYIEELEKLQVTDFSVQEILAANRSISLLRGDAFGVNIISYQDAGSVAFDHVIMTSLNSEQYPPLGEDKQTEFEQAYNAGSDVTMIRSRFTRDGEIAQPGLFWNSETVIEREAYVPRQLARFRARSYKLPANMAEAAERLSRERIPMGFLQGLRTTYSVTELESFLRCPYGWFVEYVLQPEGHRADPAARRGSWLHGLLAKVVAVEPVGRQESLEYIWNNDERVDDIFTAAEKSVYKQRTVAVVEKYAHMQWAWPKHYLEYDLKGNILPDKDYITITGRADRIDTDGKELLVIDYKNRRKLQRPSTGAKLRDLQSTLYPHLASINLEMDALGMMYISLLHNDHEGLFARREMSLVNQTSATGIYDEQLGRALAEASIAVEQIQTGDIARTGQNCPAWCHHHLMSQTTRRML